MPDRASLEETSSLIDLRDALTDTSGLFRTNWTQNTDVCTWRGVTCSYSGVTLLNLRGKDLKGELPEDVITRLPNLHALYLQGNRITGNFKLGEILKTCKKIKAIYLDSGNHFKGNFGVEEGQRLYASELRVLNLANNQLDGPLPSFASMDALEEIDLRGNDFKGRLHPSVFELKNLRTLHVQHNSLVGDLPTTAPKKKRRFPKALKAFVLSGNSFTGPLPGWLFELAGDTLLDVDLSSNEFTGTVPDSIGRMPEVKAIDLSHNRLTGKLPTTFDIATALEFINLEHNRLRGDVPEQLGELFKLKSINIGNNLFSGELSLELASAPQLSELVVENNWDLCGLVDKKGDERVAKLRRIMRSTEGTAIGMDCERLSGFESRDPDEL